MKKMFLVITLCLLGCEYSFAQIAQGTKWLSGSASFYSRNGENSYTQPFYYQNSNNKSSSWSISPNFGYFIRENQILGIGFLATHHDSQSEGSYQTLKNNYHNKYNLYGGQTLYRKYFLLAPKFYIATEGNINFQTGKSSTTYNDFNNDTLSTIRVDKSNLIKAQLGGKAIIVYFISPKLSAELSLGGINIDYNRQRGTTNQFNNSDQSENINDIKSSEFSFSSSFFFNNISLGFQFYFQ